MRCQSLWAAYKLLVKQLWIFFPASPLRLDRDKLSWSVPDITGQNRSEDFGIIPHSPQNILHLHVAIVTLHTHITTLTFTRVVKWPIEIPGSDRGCASACSRWCAGVWVSSMGGFSTIAGWRLVAPGSGVSWNNTWFMQLSALQGIVHIIPKSHQEGLHGQSNTLEA